MLRMECRVQLNLFGVKFASTRDAQTPIAEWDDLTRLGLLLCSGRQRNQTENDSSKESERRVRLFRGERGEN